MKITDKIEQEYSALKGIDTRVGLELTQQDTKLYSKLLLLFHQTQSDFSAQFHQVMQADNLKEMHHLAHSLKGAAGSIGANKLQETALNLELACQLEEKLKDILLSEVITELDIVLSGIEKYNTSKENDS